MQEPRPLLPEMEKKHLSPIAHDVIRRCALELGTSVEALLEEFDDDGARRSELGDVLPRKMVEYCSTKALHCICGRMGEKFGDGAFSRFTFDMMLAWEMTNSINEKQQFSECVAKEKEERGTLGKINQQQDEISLFYSDIMPLLVSDEPSVGEDAFVWLGTILPLVADLVSRRFTFETLTAPTSFQLHFPAYDRFLKEIDRCIERLQNQKTPTEIELGDDEYILHVEGTPATQKVIRHIGETSWPGRLTLTNYALYFEASGISSYENAIKINLSKDSGQSIKAVATGPWGAPVFNKAISYESSDLLEGIVLEFPEITSSTRRDHWHALLKEVMLLHRFLSKFKVESPTQAWEVHARMILGIIRLHAAREMLKISPPTPTKFLIFSLLDELPKGDIVLEELSEYLKTVNGVHSCSASSILRSLNMNLSRSSAFSPVEALEVCEEKESTSTNNDKVLSLDNAINQAREEEKEIEIAKATTESIREEGITHSIHVLLEQLRPLQSSLEWLQEVLTWKKPVVTLFIMVVALIVTYTEWVGKALAAGLVSLVVKMLQLRHEKIRDKSPEVVTCTGSNEQTAIGSIVTAQHRLRTISDLVQLTIISILKIQSILVSRSPKHANQVMMMLVGLAILSGTVPLKFIIMGLILSCSLSASRLGKYLQKEQGDYRRLREWWDSIPVIPVQTIDKVPNSPKKQN